MEEAAANWGYDQRYEGKFHDGTFKNWSGHRTSEFRFAARDGLTIFVTSEEPKEPPFWLADESPDEDLPAVE